MRKPLWFVTLLAVFLGLSPLALATEAFLRPMHTRNEGSFVNLVLSSALPFRKNEVSVDHAAKQLMFFVTQDSNYWPEKYSEGMEATIKSINEASLIAFLNVLSPAVQKELLDKLGVTSIMEELSSSQPTLVNALRNPPSKGPFAYLLRRIMKELDQRNPALADALRNPALVNALRNPPGKEAVSAAFSRAKNLVARTSQLGHVVSPLEAFYVQWILTARVSDVMGSGDAKAFNNELSSYYFAMLYELKTTEGIGELPDPAFKEVWRGILDAPDLANLDPELQKNMHKQISKMARNIEDMTNKDVAIAAERVLNPKPDFSISRFVRTASVAVGVGASLFFYDMAVSHPTLGTVAQSVLAAASTFLSLNLPDFLAKRRLKKTEAVINQIDSDHRSTVLLCEEMLH